jgi:hypothetical protein
VPIREACLQVQQSWRARAARRALAALSLQLPLWRAGLPRQIPDPINCFNPIYFANRGINWMAKRVLDLHAPGK